MKRKQKNGIFVLAVILLLTGCARKDAFELAELSESSAEWMRVEDTNGNIGNLPNDNMTVNECSEKTGNEYSTKSENEYGAKTENVMKSDAGENVIFVHVCGAVVNPGVYELAYGCRVYEALEMAGGMLEEADESYVNQAAGLQDGMKLYIPTVQEVQSGIVAKETTEIQMTDGVTAEDRLININTATEENLCGITGIGATRAAAIVAYREQHGSFSKKEDIMNVAGIKQGTYDKIKDAICVK